jgi:hypothetical protein
MSLGSQRRSAPRLWASGSCNASLLICGAGHFGTANEIGEGLCPGREGPWPASAFQRGTERTIGNGRPLLLRQGARGLHMSARSKIGQSFGFTNADRLLTKGANISAPQAERLRLHPDWPTWPMGATVRASWEWLFIQVEKGTLPDVPCSWCDTITPGRSAIYWLDTKARTRHLIVDNGSRILTSPSSRPRARRQRVH